jgi:hypothetical protein
MHCYTVILFKNENLENKKFQQIVCYIPVPVHSNGEARVLLNEYR